MPEGHKNNYLIQCSEFNDHNWRIACSHGCRRLPFQDLALSLTIKGPLADDAIFVLSDGKERHEMDFIPTTGSAGGVWWIVHKLNEEHARDASQGNYVAEQTGRPEEAKSFWYASSREALALKGMLQESENYNNAGSGEPIAINWSSIDANSSNLRIVYKKVGDNDGNVTLASNNWTNAEYKNREVKPDEVLTFKKKLDRLYSRNHWFASHCIGSGR